MTWRGLTSCQLPGGPLKSRWNKLATTWTAQNGSISRCVAAGAPHSNWRVMMNSGAFKRHPLDPHTTHQSTQQQPFENQDKKDSRHHYIGRVYSCQYGQANAIVTSSDKLCYSRRRGRLNKYWYMYSYSSWTWVSKVAYC